MNTRNESIYLENSQIFLITILSTLNFGPGKFSKSPFFEVTYKRPNTKLRISQMSHLKWLNFDICCFLTWLFPKWTVSEVTHFWSKFFSNWSIAMWPISEVTYFQNERFRNPHLRNDRFRKDPASEVTHSSKWLIFRTDHFSII